MFSLIIICTLLTLMGLQQSISGYIETVTISACENCTLQLTCRHFSSILAIYSAEFVPFFDDDVDNNTINIRALAPFPPIHPRQALNRRCSGAHHCSFILTKDCPGASWWGPGNLTVTYACISADRITSYCNSEISLPGQQDSGISEGFLHNPGYPRFYSTQKECRWRIKAPSQQLIQLRILDISVTADHTIFPDDCTDRLEIFDSGQLIETVCKAKEPPLEILSSTDFVEVVLVSSHSLVPLRGVLVHYTAVGCPTPPAPEDGYLVYRNDTAAEFRCCVGFVFPDDEERTRIITCLGSHWDAHLPFPNCKRKSPSPFVEQSRKPVSNQTMASDILAPALLIVSLFLINFIVLFYIHKLKKKDEIDCADEELGTLPVLKNKEETLP